MLDPVWNLMYIEAFVSPILIIISYGEGSVSGVFVFLSFQNLEKRFYTVQVATRFHYPRNLVNCKTSFWCTEGGQKATTTTKLNYEL